MFGKTSSIASAVVAVFLAAAPNVSAEKGTEDPNLDLGQSQEVRNSWIFELSTSPGQAESAARSAVGGVGGRLKYVYTNGFVGFAASMPEPAVQQLLDNNPSVTSATRDVVITTAKPPGSCDPWPECKNGGGDDGTDDGGDTSSDEVPWSTARVGGPVDCTTSACAPVVYIMDTGIGDHQDLNVHTSRSFSCLDGFSPSNYQDQNGHGTHVAGTVGAKLNGVDTAGVAAGVDLASARILDENGNGLMSDALCAMNEINGQVANDTNLRGSVVNMSFMTAEAETGITAFENAIVAGITEHDLFFAVAAGNNVISGPPFLRTNYTAEDLSPARVGDYESDGEVDPGIYTVSAIDSNDALADFSVSAKTFWSPAAPGVGVVSSKLGGGTTTKDGTSMAAPHVAGLLAACTSVDIESQGTATNDDVGTPDPIAFCSDALTN